MIGVVTTSYPRTPEDSAGVFVRERVRALQREGHRIEILAAGERASSTDDAHISRIGAGNLFYSGGAPEALEDARPWPRLAAWGQALAFSLSLLGRLTEQGRRWNAVESHWLLPCGLLVSMALSKLPHRAHIHGGDLHLLARLPWADSLGRVFCRTHPEIVFASAALHEGFAALIGAPPESLGARCQIEAAAFDKTVFRPHSAEERQRLRIALSFTAPTLLAAGRLVPIKGFDVLVDAVGRIPPGLRPDLVIAGDGPERARLASQACALGVHLRLPGQLGQPLLAEHMAAAVLFVHPCRTLKSGRSEGMPLVVREALACNLAVIASASGGLREIEGNQGLRLVEPEDPAGLAAAIVGSETGDP